MRDLLGLWVEKFSQAWAACLLCMVQGDLTVVSMKHAMIAAKTGSLSGLAFVFATFLPWNGKWIAVWLTGIFTMLADIIIHPSHFGANWTEALVTGIVAMGIAVLFEKIFNKDSSPQYKKASKMPTNTIWSARFNLFFNISFTLFNFIAGI